MAWPRFSSILNEPSRAVKDHEMYKEVSKFLSKFYLVSQISTYIKQYKWVAKHTWSY